MKKDILDLIKKEHEEVKQLMAQIIDEGERGETFQTLKKNVIAHAKAEQAVLYPRLKRAEEFDVQVKEYEKEHELAEQLLKEAEEHATGSKDWQAKIEVLREQLEHHIEEEEDIVFSEMKNLYEKEERDTMAEEYEKVRQKQLESL